jgi:Na+/phosphate symporter
MLSRFITSVLALLAGAFVVVASQAFSASTTGWIAFGVALGILGMTAVAQLDRNRGRVQGAFDAVIGALSIWSVVAAVVFSGAALTWLSCGDFLGLAVLACAGLIAHELGAERAVYELGRRELGDDPAVEAYVVAA